MTPLMTSYETTALAKDRDFSWTESRPRMEEEARKLLAEGIKKKLISPGKGDLSTFPNGTKVRPPVPATDRVQSRL